MRAVAMPGGTFAPLLREWQRIGNRLCPRWRYASRSNAFGAETSAPLPGLIEALAPLGMPDVQYASRRSYGGGWVTRTCAATYAAVSWAHSTVINGAAVLVIHLAAIRYVFLPIGTV
jgi:hypothetical protein